MHIAGRFQELDRLSLLTLLADEIDSLPARRPIRVAIDGPDAAGKTTMANELADILQQMGRQVIRASIDGFHNPKSIRYRLGELSPEGYYLDSFDYDALITSLLAPLGPGGSRQYRLATFNHIADTPATPAEKVASDDAILLLDGIFLLRPLLFPYWDYSILVLVTAKEALRRALARDSELFGGPDSVRERYSRRYLPAQERYIAKCRPQELASRVVDNEDPSKPSLSEGFAYSRSGTRFR